MATPMGARWAVRILSAAPGRRYHVMQNPSVWAHFKGLLERGLRVPFSLRLRSVWGFVLPTTGRAVD